MDLASKRVAIYARVSTEEQAEDEVPIAAQIKECREYAEGRSWQVVEVFTDEGISGRTDARPEFQRMIGMAKLKPAPFDTIVVWKGNRLSRRVEHRLTYKSLLRKQGINIVSVKEPEMDGPLAALVEVVLAGVDEFMCEQIAEDTLRGLKEVARQGYSTGGRPPKGYRNVKKVVGLKKNGQPIMRTAWEPDPEWKDKALLVFQMAAKGKPGGEICQVTGVVKNKSSLSTYLRNRAFIGERIYNRRCHIESKAIRRWNNSKDWIVVPEAHEAIIPKELFDKVQEVLAAKHPKVGSARTFYSDYLLTSLLWCKEHNCRYIGYRNRDREYYVCSLRNKSGRKNASCALLKREPLEDFIFDRLRQDLFEPQRIREMFEEINRGIVQERGENEKERRQLEIELAKVERELGNLYKAIREGIPASDLKEPIEETKLRQLDLMGKMEALERKTEKPIKITNELV